MNALGITEQSCNDLKQVLSIGLLESDLTKLKDLMLRLGTKMLDPEYRHQYAASLGDYSLNISRKMVDFMCEGKENSVSIIRLLAKYFEILNIEGSGAIAALNQYAQDEAATAQTIRNSLLGMASAKQMGFSANDINTVGTLGLFSKIGTVVFRPEVSDLNRNLNDLEKVELMRVPLRLSSLLASIMGLDPALAPISQQIYELSDGTGYPRRLIEKNISPIARIIKVVDTYTSLTEKRPHRNPVDKHVACVQLLKMAKQGKIEARSVDALLSVVGLYPKGVQVELSDGRLATCLQSGSNVSAPVVQLDSLSDPLHLSSTDLKISRVLFTENNERISSLQEIPG